MLLWALFTLYISTEILLPAAKSGSAYGISVTPDESVTLSINDFSFLFIFVKKAWLGQTTADAGPSIYSLENHLKITSDWAGIKLNSALPFGYSPTMLWILAPLIAFSHTTALCLFNLAGLFCIWWITHPVRCRFGIGLAAFLSPLAISCFILGQTAFLTGAGLLFIAEKTKGRSGNNWDWKIAIIAGAVLWALTAKPPLALTAGAVLIGLRQWRPLLAAVVISAFSTLLIAPLLGADWIRDYLRTIGSFDLINAGSAYAWSIVPSQMANLRGILSVDFGVADDAASRFSGIVWFIALIFIAAAGNRSRFREGALWSLGILSYLLFCPHVSGNEEHQLVLLIPLCVQPQNNLRWQELVLLLFVPLLPFASPAIGLFAGNRMVLFIIKIALVIFIAGFMRLQATSTPCCRIS